MNRKDIIIVAVVLNCCLLAFLFISSRSKTPEKVTEQVAYVPTKRVPVVKKEAPKAPKAPKAPVLVPKKPKVEKVIAKAKAPADTTTITVQKGDVLERIAKAHKVKVDEIIALNNLPSTQLKVGQLLKIPPSSIKQEKVQKPAVKEENHVYYVVKGGDNPWTIAMKNKIQVEELLRLNQLDEKGAKKLRPGDKLRIK